MIQFFRWNVWMLVMGMGLVLLSCSDDSDDIGGRKFGIFEVLDDDITVEMDGTINRSSFKNFNEMEDAFPNIQTIRIKNCDGSSDDETNLQLSARVHQRGMDTYLMEGGIIASGGVDFFLAGVRRTRGANTMIGVHSWADGDGNEATDYPVGHENHLLYINYYVSVGFSQQAAEDFYYFTINAAPAEEIYYMTDAEVERYGILKE